MLNQGAKKMTDKYVKNIRGVMSEAKNIVGEAKIIAADAKIIAEDVKSIVGKNDDKSNLNNYPVSNSSNMIGQGKKKSKKGSKKSSKKSSKGGAERINPIVLAAKMATALFKEFGEQTNELNAKGEKKWKLSDIKDGIPFRTTLGKILKENNGDVDKAIDDAKKRYKSGALQKAVKATAEQQQAKKNSKKMSRIKKTNKKTSKKTSKKASKKH